MDVEIKIDNKCKSPKIVIYTDKITPPINDLVKKLSGETSKMLTGFKDDEVYLINPEEIINIYSENHRIFVRTKLGIYKLKTRLYELEEMFEGTHFIRISNSEIVNFKYVESLDMSMSGTISIKLKTGGNSFVSRRYVNKIKEYLGL